MGIQNAHVLKVITFSEAAQCLHKDFLLATLLLPLRG